MLDFLTTPPREPKPRKSGVTHVLDKGLGVRHVEDLLETSREWMDIVKLGWGTGYVTGSLAEKVALYQKAGVPVCFGGTLLEVAIAQGKFDEFRRAVTRMHMDHVEFSTGVLEMELDRKFEYVRQLAKEFVVLAEVGSKDAKAEVDPVKWVAEAKGFADAGAWKVIAEARESGTVGIYSHNGEVRSSLVDDLVRSVTAEKLLFEAPQKNQQVWFIKMYGPAVNLGNIAPEEVIPLETLRQGLRGDTMPLFHLNGR